MSTRQFLALFLCSLVPWTVGNGLLPLLPIYASQLGAEPAIIGYYLASSYVALALGTIIAGWLSDKLQRRKILLISTSLVCIPTLWLMGQATNIGQLAVLTATVWFFAGVGITLLSILTGLWADKAKRGKIFGLLALTGALGSLIGGLTTGPIADRWGYSTLFGVLALVWIIQPLAALFLQDGTKRATQRDNTPTAQGNVKFGGPFFLLLLASTVAGVVVFIGNLGGSLAMHDLGFASTGISSAKAISGLMTLPLPFLIGWLSDRAGRKRLMAFCYAAGFVGMFTLVPSTSLWHFWTVATLLAVLGVSNSVGSALVTDLVPQAALGKGISLFGATTWVGGILGFAGTGYAIQHLGMTNTFILGAMLPLIAIVLLIPVRRTKDKQMGTTPLVPSVDTAG